MSDIVQYGDQLARSTENTFTPCVLSWGVVIHKNTQLLNFAGYSKEVVTSKRWRLESTMDEATFDLFECFMIKAGVSHHLSNEPSDVGVFQSVNHRPMGDFIVVDFVFEAFKLPELNQTQLRQAISQLQLEGASEYSR
jgi:hypothetical protein